MVSSLKFNRFVKSPEDPTVYGVADTGTVGFETPEQFFKSGGATDWSNIDVVPGFVPSNAVPYSQYNSRFIGGGPSDESSKWAGQSNQPQNNYPVAEPSAYRNWGGLGSKEAWGQKWLGGIQNAIAAGNPAAPSGLSNDQLLNHLAKGNGVWGNTARALTAGANDSLLSRLRNAHAAVSQQSWDLADPERVWETAVLGTVANDPGHWNTPFDFSQPTSTTTPNYSTDYTAADLPNPNQIVGPAWMRLPESTKQFLLGLYKERGWDEGDVVDAIVKNLPGRAAFRAPWSPTVRR